MDPATFGFTTTVGSGVPASGTACVNTVLRLASWTSTVTVPNPKSVGKSGCSAFDTMVMAAIRTGSASGATQRNTVVPSGPGPAENHDVVAAPSTASLAGNSLPGNSD